MLNLKQPLTIIVTMITVFIVVNNFLIYPTNTIAYDVFGYYLYLPLAFLFEGDSQEAIQYLNEIRETYSSSETFYQIQTLPNGEFVMKYTSGWAICYAPFFFIGHLVALLSGYPADGFSQPYQVAIFSGSLFYSLVGIYFLVKLLRQFFGKSLTVALVLILVFGTNYLVHVTMYGQNAMSHNLLFTLYTLIIWLTIKWYKTRKTSTIIFLGIVCGLTILIRPTEFVCLIIPLLWPTTENRITLFKSYIKQLFIFTLFVILLGSVQLIYWKMKTGDFLFIDYGNPAEGLDLLGPHTMDTLFSFRKGWFIYTPIMLFATMGFIAIYRMNRKLFLPLFTFFVLNLYLVSSWSCWWYATSFSQRALIPSMVIMLIPLGYLLKFIWTNKPLLQYLTGAIVVILITLNIFQSIQFHKGVIPGDRMTKEYYFSSFGSLTPNEELKKDLLLIDRYHPGKIDYQDKSKYSQKTILLNTFEDSSASKAVVNLNGNQTYKLDSNHIFSEPFKIAYNEITDRDHAFIRVTAKIYKVGKENNLPCLLTASFDYKNKVYKWESVSLEKLPFEEWETIELIYLTPEPRTLQDHLTVHFWHRNLNTIYIDDFKVEVFEPKNKY